MKKRELIHFVEWKKMEADQHPQVMSDLFAWGVRHIVFHPIWGERERQRPGYLTQIAHQLQTAGLDTPACHGFWTNTNVLGWSEELERQQAVQHHGDFLRQLTEFGVKTYTVHLGQKLSQSSEFFWGQIRRSVDSLLPIAEKSGIILALENLNESVADLEKFADFLAEYHHPYLGICFDTGHANCYSKLGLFGTLELLKPHIVTTHMHDNHGNFDDHNPPGAGNIDWPQLIRELKNCPRLVHAETESGDWSQKSWDIFNRLWSQY